MNIAFKRRLFIAVAGGVTVLALTGCQSHDASESAFYQDANNMFPGEHTTRDMQVALDAQAAHGARVDATLQPAHFDGPELNSLGRGKLDLMLADTESTAKPMVVYVNGAKDDPSLSPRATSVSDYLTARGIAAADLKVEAGPNPASFHSSQPSLIRLPKTESPEATGGVGTGVGATAAVDAK